MMLSRNKRQLCRSSHINTPSDNTISTHPINPYDFTRNKRQLCRSSHINTPSDNTLSTHPLTPYQPLSCCPETRGNFAEALISTHPLITPSPHKPFNPLLSIFLFLLETRGNFAEAAEMEDYESKKPKLARAIIEASKNGDRELALQLCEEMNSLATLRFDPTNPEGLSRTLTEP